MRTLRSILTASALGASLALAAPALASEPTGGDHAEAADHGGDAHGAAAGEHGAAGGEHGDDEHHSGGHHVDYTGDADGDGMPNWMDFDDPGEDSALVLDNLLFHGLNLLILIGLGFFFARRPILDAVRARSLDIRKELVDSAKARDEAQQKYAELEARLGAFEEEVSKMRAEGEADARKEEAALIARANEAADRIAETAERNIRDEVARAQYALRKEAVELAVQLAEQTLSSQVGADDNKRLARQFLDSLNEVN